MKGMIRHILLDLDDTLYEGSEHLSSVVDARMTEFVARLLEVPEDQALRMRRYYASRYGSTLTWLSEGCGLPAPLLDAFLEYVHPEDIRPFILRPEVDETWLAGLEAPFSIFTNAPLEHALRVLSAIDVSPGLFTRIFDVRACGYRGKPHASAYQHVLSSLGIPASASLLVDDREENVRALAGLGGYGVLLLRDGQEGPYPFPTIRSLRELPRILEELDGRLARL
ncbi:predictive hydrolase, haloacid dehalogenase-like family [Spirochaeta thermophila DSM 6192]|uniref:Predictive hydrolase, haloacid dehalogenase-like family n=2 Tax=Winmispira thermophila TaxID=154 RepID=E0RP61_WINT6|nr:predictive hydrolase, haloacid dehalogenase-like family [Spirochaeta thermophila DSM 6192]